MTKAATVNWAGIGTTWVSRNLMSRRTHIPVFNETALVVRVKPVGATPGVLCRHPRFDKELTIITDAVLADFGKGAEGMLYCLYALDNGAPIPMYVGISRATGHTGKLSSLFRNPRKKPRFDDYDGYHIGDLSTQVIPGYAKKKAYKKVWADRMFSNAPNHSPRLRQHIYFWGTAWGATSISAIAHLGHTPLFLEETILVHAFRTGYPGVLLNQ